MPAYTFRNVGTADQQNGACTAGAPAGVIAGDLLLLNAVCRNNSFTLGTPSGWTKLSGNVNDTEDYIFGRIATGSGDAPPTLTWSGTAQSLAQCVAFSGSVFTDLTNIVHATVDSRNSLGGNDVVYTALTVTAANCLVIARGVHNKTSTSNGSTLTNLAGFTQIDAQNPNGSVFNHWWGYQQQTTATNLGGVTQTRTGVSETLQATSLYLVLKTLSASSAANKAFLLNQQSINNG